MVSINKKKKAKNAYFHPANKTTMKLKRVNFFNKINRKEINKEDGDTILEMEEG